MLRPAPRMVGAVTGVVAVGFRLGGVGLARCRTVCRTGRFHVRRFSPGRVRRGCPGWRARRCSSRPSFFSSVGMEEVMGRSPAAVAAPNQRRAGLHRSFPPSRRRFRRCRRWKGASPGFAPRNRDRPPSVSERRDSLRSSRCDGRRRRPTAAATWCPGRYSISSMRIRICTIDPPRDGSLPRPSIQMRTAGIRFRLSRDHHGHGEERTREGRVADREPVGSGRRNPDLNRDNSP